MRSMGTDKQETKQGVPLELRWYSGLTDDEAKELLRPFKKEKGMSWLNKDIVVWVLAYYDDEPVGVVALMPEGGSGRCKSDVVLPEMRGLGVYEVLSTKRIEIAKSMGLTSLTCFAGDMSYPMFVRSGFTVVSESSGIRFMRCILTN